ncbi:DMT family transporter [Peribacillus butanolivorans]|uniref:DMT family transporter n=1 Tax=Peribacillus butanolivorans TaxID=421767 RepID=UPI0035E2B161
MIRSYLLLLICVICWGSNFVFGAILVKDFPPMLLSATRLLFIIIFIALYALKKKKWNSIQKKDWLTMILLGFIGTFINQWSFYAALETAHPTTSALILALAPITTALLAAVFLRERLTKRFLLGSIVALAGVFLVIASGGTLHLSIGLIWIFLTMLSFSISIIMIRKLTERNHSITITLYSNLIGFGGLLPIALLSESLQQMSREPWPWVLLIVTAIIMHGICTLIWNNQIQIVGASKASMFLNLEPFVAMLVGLVVLKNSVTPSQLFGALLIIIGVVLSTAFKGKRVMEEAIYSQEA